MPAVWTYPWNLEQEGVDAACRTFADHGIDAVNLASQYHSVRSMQPRFPDQLFTSYPGGCYFAPDPERFAATPIDPIQNEVVGFDDPLDEIVSTATDHGIDVNAWMVCLHNSRLGAQHSEFRMQSAFGDAHDHAFCPSYPEVQTYFAAVVETVAARGVVSIQLESLGFQSPFHEHGWRWNHAKRQAVTNRVEEVLLSQCFCEGCQAAAADHPIDLEHARTIVQNLLRESFAGPQAQLPSLDELVRDRPVLQDLFDFRAMVVTQFGERLAAAAGSTPLSYYVMEGHLGEDPNALWPAGVRPGQLAEQFDRLMAMCYVGEPTVARERVNRLRESVACPIDAGVTLDPAVIEDEAAFLALVNAVRDHIDGSVSVYHHGLLTDAHLDWLQAAFTA